MTLLTLNLNPPRRVLVQFGFVSLFAFGFLGWWCLRKGGILGFDFGTAARPVGFVLMGVGALHALFSLVRPSLNRPLFAGLTLLTYPIGLVVSTVLLVVLFFVIITPVGLTLRLLGKDPLHRRWHPDAQTYWVDREEARPPASYFKQF
jgi:hypothetical protein